jgi:phosphatidylglycerophosphatase A
MRGKFLSCFGLNRFRYSEVICLVVATIVGAGVITLLNASSLFSLAFALGVVGVFEINKFLDSGGEKGDILIGKAVGLWISFSAIIFGAIKHNLPYPLLISGVLSFGLFLLFTAWRPSTISWLDRNLKGGLGVILSEVLAGFAGGILGLLVLNVVSKVLK